MSSMALRQITGAKMLQESQRVSLQAWASSSQHRLLNVSTSCSEKKDQPDERTQSASDYASHTAESNTGFFTDGVRAVIGSATQKVKEAVGLEKPMGKEGSQKGMEPAGVMENKSASGDRSAQYGELLDKHKQANDELLKGANVSDLYNKENTTATSAANTKAGGDQRLGGEGASAPHDK